MSNPTRIKDVDVIREWYTDERGRMKLNDRQEAKLERMVFIYDKVVKKAMATHKVIKLTAKFYEISDRQAFNDLRDAKELFGGLAEVKKEAMRHIVYEYALKAYNIALNAKDIKGLNASIRNMAKIWALDKQDPDLPDFSKLKQNLYPVILDDPVRDMFMKLAANGVIDLTKFMQNVAAQSDVIEIEGKSVDSDQSGD